jgi:DNA-binding transcriptional ArsR family regulator
MLRRLAEEPAGLAELTAEIGLAKSTVFHHIGVLRAAGLVRVQVGGGSEKNPLYSLRAGALDTAFEHTRKYLEVSERTEGS